MRIALDVGNTETVLGLAPATENRPQRVWRIATRIRRTGDEWAYLLRSLIRESGADPDSVTGAILGSVVPAITRELKTALAGWVGENMLWVDGATGLDVDLDVDDPSTVGADRIANALGCAVLYGRDSIVVDLGTATTFDCIRASGAFEGGVIAPGILAGLEWLSGRTAMLPAIDFLPPERVIGRRTESCMRSGVFYSAIDTIDGMVLRIAEEWSPRQPLVVSTGGLSPVVGPHCSTIAEIEPELTLVGLFEAGRRRL